MKETRFNPEESKPAGSGGANVSAAIKGIVKDLMDRVMDRVLRQDPFIPEQHRASKPLYAALVPDEIFKGAHFERRFVTPFGNVWEKLATVVAQERHGHCSQGELVSGLVGTERLRRIQEVLSWLEHPSSKAQRSAPSWTEEIRYILAGGGPPVPTTVTCDLYVHSRVDRKRYAFELKGPLPNSDQTKVSKEKMFKLLAMDSHPVDGAYYALPYNPYGAKEDYAWSFPLRWFDMKHDPSVLIGDEFWDFIGGDGTYRVFISEINALGNEYRERIYREFLGMEPPGDDSAPRLK